MNSKRPAPDPVCIACAIFRDQLEEPDGGGLPDLQLRSLPSMLHMDPDRLDRALGALIQQEREQNHPVGLPWETISVDAEVLRAAIETAREKLKRNHEH